MFSTRTISIAALIVASISVIMASVLLVQVLSTPRMTVSAPPVAVRTVTPDPSPRFVRTVNLSSQIMFHDSIGTEKWIIDVAPGKVGIIAGAVVNGKRLGVYQALHGPYQIEMQVTDAIIKFSDEDKAGETWCQMLADAKHNKWVVSYIEAHTEWPACPEMPSVS